MSTKDILRILALGKAVAEHELRLLDYSHAAVAGLAETHTLMLVTKGDLMDQERKIAASGLAEYFQYVEIVSDKNPETYAAMRRKHGLRPEGFLMVGNSMRSDILTVLEMGGWAVHVPHELTWTHEKRPAPVENERFFEIEHLGLLWELVEKIDYYLNHAEERCASLAAGQKRVLSDHTYRHRAKTLQDQHYCHRSRRNKSRNIGTL